MPDDHLEQGAADLLEQLASTDVRQRFTRCVEECLPSLTAEQREALQHATDGMTIQEIADRVGVSYDVANGRLDRARRAMRDLLAQHGFRCVRREELLPDGATTLAILRDGTLVVHA